MTRNRHRNRLARCQGKVSYPSQRAANRTLQRCSQERGTSLRVYECPICDGWHLTKQAPREQAPAALTPTADELPPGLYQLTTGRVWAAEELVVLRDADGRRVVLPRCVWRGYETLVIDAENLERTA